jgi:hypothetical protein
MPALHPFAFFERLVWLDGTPLLDTIEEYRRQVFTEVFTTSTAIDRSTIEY